MVWTANDMDFGLCTENGSVPLAGVRVEGDILGRTARVRVAQRFVNRERTAIEAVYRFPLPEGAAVRGLTIRTGERTLRGVVEEREKAFRIYDEALSRGDAGYLLDEERPNIFTVSAGNLAPGADALVEIEYVAVLDGEGGAVRFRLPTTISPRYLPAGTPDRDGIPETDVIHPPYAATVPYGLSISLAIRPAGAVASVESPSHPIRMEKDGDAVRVSFAAETAAMDRDFVLTIGSAESGRARAYLGGPKGDRVLQIEFPFDGEPAGAAETPAGERDICFLLDCSGSMQGTSISQAKRALEICLKALADGTPFNICRFGSSFDMLFPAPRPADPRTLRAALALLARTGADLGGTEILGPLTAVCGAARRGTTVILLTDGEVGNEKELMDLAAAHRERVRIFPVGIGAGPNDHLVKGLARASGGRETFIFPGERIEPKVLRVFGSGMKHPAEGLAVLDTAADRQSPRRPTVFPGESALLFARWKATAVPETIRVRGRIDGIERTWEVPVSDAGAAGDFTAALWAREAIRDLEEAPGETGSRQARKRPSAASRIVALSKEYGILSSLTSFVAVDEREEKHRLTGEIVLRKVPVPLTVGWHSGDVTMDQALLHRAAFPVSGDVCYRLRAPSCMGGMKDAAVEPDADDLLVEILSSQRSSGGFDLAPALAARIGLDMENLRTAAAGMESSGPLADPVGLLATALVLAVLDLRFADAAPVWRAVVAKSAALLARAVKESSPRVDGAPLETWARKHAALLPMDRPRANADDVDF